jgi:hypothetical protein
LYFCQDDSFTAPYFNVKLGEAEWKEIYDAIQWRQENNNNNNNNPNINETNAFKPPPEWVKIQVDFLLDAGSVAMQIANGDPISILTFYSLHLGLLLRDKWITVRHILMTLTDFITTPQNCTFFGERF